MGRHVIDGLECWIDGERVFDGVSDGVVQGALFLTGMNHLQTRPLGIPQ